VMVTDNGVPSLSATQFFTVTVQQPARPTLMGSGVSSGIFRFVVVGDEGPDYAILESPDLSNWTPMMSLSSPSTPLVVSDPARTNYTRFFYRVQLGP
jgi:hypothetical protein